MNIIYLFLFLIILIGFLYYGYKDDYKRDKIGFKTSLAGIIGSSIIVICLVKFESEIDILIKHELQKYYIEQLGWKQDMEIFHSKTEKSAKDIEEFIARNSIITEKIDHWLSIIGILFFALIYMIVRQFNKMVKRYFQIKVYNDSPK